MSVDYDDTQDSYRAIEVENNITKEIKRFDTGDAVVDYYWFKKWLYSNKSNLSGLSVSSSFDHFIMDGDKYLEKYVNPDTLNFYTREEIDAMLFSQLSTMDEVVITNELKTFAQVREYVKERKPELFYENFVDFL